MSFFSCCLNGTSGADEVHEKSSRDLDEPSSATSRDEISVDYHHHNGHEDVVVMQPRSPAHIGEHSAQDERREREEREIARTRGDIDGFPSELPEPTPDRRRGTTETAGLTLTFGKEKAEGGDWLSLPPNSPMIAEAAVAEEEDWAGSVLQSVSRAGSAMSFYAEKEEERKPEETAQGLEVKGPNVEQENVKQENVKQEAVSKDVPVVEQHKPELEKASLDDDETASIYTFRPRSHQRSSNPAISSSVSPPHPTLLPASPPTPAVSISDLFHNGNRISLTSLPPPRAVSPAPSIAISDHSTVEPEYSKRISTISTYSTIIDPENDKRISTISTFSTIAASAASVARDRYSAVFSLDSSHRFSTYSTLSRSFSRRSRRSPTPGRSRPTSPAPTMAVAALSAPTKAAMSLPLHEHPILAPNLSGLNPVLEKLEEILETTSILSSYSHWEASMSLRREIRAFLGCGVEDHVYWSESGELSGVKESLGYLVTGLVVRGEELARASELGDGAVKKTDEAVGKAARPGLGGLRAFWQSGAAA